MGELCVPGCRYRSLYEGSQASLGDMASKQARSVAEHRQLRVELARLLKRYFPREYQAAERSLGTPMADADDAVVVAYLDELLQARHIDGGLAGLRAALVDAGFDITSDDVDQWSEAVRSRPAAAPPQAPAPAAPTSAATTSPAATEPAPDSLAVVGPAPQADVAPLPDGPPATDMDEPLPGVDALDDLLRDLGAAPPPQDEPGEPVPDAPSSTSSTTSSPTAVSPATGSSCRWTTQCPHPSTQCPHPPRRPRRRPRWSPRTTPAPATYPRSPSLPSTTPGPHRRARCLPPQAAVSTTSSATSRDRLLRRAAALSSTTSSVARRRRLLRLVAAVSTTSSPTHRRHRAPRLRGQVPTAARPRPGPPTSPPPARRQRRPPHPVGRPCSCRSSPRS